MWLRNAAQWWSCCLVCNKSRSSVFCRTQVSENASIDLRKTLPVAIAMFSSHVVSVVWVLVLQNRGNSRSPSSASCLLVVHLEGADFALSNKNWVPIYVNKRPVSLSCYLTKMHFSIARCLFLTLHDLSIQFCIFVIDSIVKVSFK